ncbi:MAG: carbon-nitrogen hydrolase family protein [Myxococcota bacterium]
MRVGIVQMTSSDALPANLAVAEQLVSEAAGMGADFIALPEMFAYLRREGLDFPHAQPLEGDITARVGNWARRHRARILIGSFAERRDQDDRVHNTSVLISPEGEIESSYRKMHLFDVDLTREGGDAYAESRNIAAGDEVVVAHTPDFRLGLSICYDLRFPELYREMASRGAQLFTVPSAFTVRTGRDHWEVLLRARAIENLAFVVAPAQCGRHSEIRESYGRAMIVDPWGVVLAQLGDRPGVAVADCDLEEQERVRKALPVLDNRRL